MNLSEKTISILQKGRFLLLENIVILVCFESKNIKIAWQEELTHQRTYNKWATISYNNHNLENVHFGYLEPWVANQRSD